MSRQHLTPNELIMHKVDDTFLSAGFGINSILMNRGLPPMLSFTSEEVFNEDPDGKSVFTSFKHLAVPVGLYKSHAQPEPDDEEEYEYRGSMPDILHDRLLGLVSHNNAGTPGKPSSKKQKHKSHTTSAKKGKR